MIYKYKVSSFDLKAQKKALQSEGLVRKFQDEFLQLSVNYK
jgi:hypothetical protein